MEVILLNDVEKLGLRGDVVDVARGYARNFLLPRRLAEPATPGKVAELRKREEQRARHEAKSFEEAQKLADTLGKAELRFEVKAGPTGALFGSVTPTNIADELWERLKIRVDRRKVGIDSIKRVGYYGVPIELFQDVTVDVKTVVSPEGGTLPSEEEWRAQQAAEEAAEQAAAEAEEAEAAPDREGPTLEEILAADEAEAAAADPETAAEAAPADEPAGAEAVEEPGAELSSRQSSPGDEQS